MFIYASSLPSFGAKPLQQEQSFNLEQMSTLVINMNHADISVSNGDDSGIHVSLKQELRRGEAEYCLHTIKHKQTGNTLELYTEAERPHHAPDCSVRRNIAIRLDQRKLQQLEIKHSHGSFTAASFTPEQLKLAISHSKLNVLTISSRNTRLNIHHSDGKIELSDTMLDINGAHGDVFISALKAEAVETKWSHGDIEIAKSTANTFTGKFSHSDISLLDHEGGALKLRSGHGQIEVQGGLQQVALKNSHGSITFNGSSESLEVKNSHGSTRLTQNNRLFSHIEAKSSHGSISLEVPKQSMCTLEGTSLKSVQAGMFRESTACSATSGLVRLSTSHGKARVSTI